MTTFWESKYKTCRAAFLCMNRIQRAEKKIAGKERQRIIQHCHDGINGVPVGYPSEYHFKAILAILGVQR